MYSHPLSIPRPIARRQHQAQEVVRVEGNFARGFLFALLFSVPVWGLILLGVYELVR